MKIIYVPLKGNPFPMEVEPTLEIFQSLVEGSFDFTMYDAETALVHNDDQWTQPYNCKIRGQVIRGPFFLIGLGRREWKDCKKTKEEIANDIV